MCNRAVSGERNRTAVITRPKTQTSGLRKARIARGWSQERLERISGVAQTQISAIENGRDNPKPGPGTWRRLSAALGVKLHDDANVPATWFQFLKSDFATNLNEPELAALVDIAANPRWCNAPLRTWVVLIDVVRSALAV